MIAYMIVYSIYIFIILSWDLYSEWLLLYNSVDIFGGYSTSRLCFDWYILIILKKGRVYMRCSQNSTVSRLGPDQWRWSSTALFHTGRLRLLETTIATFNEAHNKLPWLEIKYSKLNLKKLLRIIINNKQSIITDKWRVGMIR